MAGAAAQLPEAQLPEAQLPEAQLVQVSQEITSQQSFFFLAKMPYGLIGSQQGWQQVGWQHDVAPQEAGAQVGAQQDGAQVTTSQQQSLLFLDLLFFCLVQQSLMQQSLTAPHEPPQLPTTVPHEPPQDEEATGAACAGMAACTGYCPALTDVSSMTKTFTGVFLRRVRDIGGRQPRWAFLSGRRYG